MSFFIIILIFLKEGGREIIDQSPQKLQIFAENCENVLNKMHIEKQQPVRKYFRHYFKIAIYDGRNQQKWETFDVEIEYKP